MNVLLDTNIFRYLGKDHTLFSRFSQKITKYGDVVFVSPVSLLEMLSHITEAEDKNTFEECAKGLWAANSLAGENVLPNPDSTLESVVRISQGVNSDRLDLYLVTFLFENVTDWGNFNHQKEITLKNGSKHRVTWRKFDLENVINTLENEYVDEMFEKVVGAVDPSWPSKKKEIGPLKFKKKGDFKKLIGLLESDFYPLIFTKNIFQYRVGFELKENDRLVDATIAIGPVAEFYKNLLLKIFKFGYRPDRKHKNDIHDFHLVFHMVDPGLIFITNDGGIKSKLPNYGHRIFTLDEFLKLKRE